MIERTIDIPTKDGATTTFIVHPERGGPHPAILFFMDAPAIREELRDMARRLASVGYYVMLPNLYYRSGVMELGSFSTPADGETRKKMFELMGSLTIPLIMEDTDALIAFLDADPAASKGPIGTVGYCMSGRYALSAAVRHPERVAAAASIYGVSLVTDQSDSPHLTVLNAPNTEFYVGCAEIDSYAPLEMVEQFAQAMSVGGVNAEVEIYPKVEHGFAFPQRAAFNKDAAERHWERLLALFGRMPG
jgi:carboxymethylenebutenolidase